MKITFLPVLILFAVLLGCQSDIQKMDERENSEPTEKPDYTSKVPQFTYASTLEEQKEQLKTNPLLLRFMESRKKMVKDPHLPLYHFVSPENRLNDPNGFCYWQGRWHLFYQAYPPEDPRQHWGHAVSTDLIHWEDLPLAIYPDPEYQCYSGSALVEDNRVIIMYHGTRVGNMVATSSDPLLLNWEKVGNKAVIPMTENSDDLPYFVYDPNIWKKDGIYYSMSGGVDVNGPDGRQVLSNYLFRSKDLKNWEYMHPFIEGDRFTELGDDGACPYFWPIGNRHIMPFYSHISGGQYFIGDYDKERDKFIVTDHDKFNFGASGPSGVHAPSATPDGKGGVICIFNMNPGYPTKGWNQIMSLPRSLTLPDGKTLMQEPAGDIESLRYDKQVVRRTTLPPNQEIVLDNIRGNAMEIIAEIDPGNAPMVELNVLRSPNREEFTRIAFYKKRGTYQGRNYIRPQPEGWQPTHKSLLTIESSYSSILPDARSRAAETAPFVLDENENLKLRIFIDKSVVEVFANGKQCVAMRVYPGLKGSTGVSLRSQGQESELISLEAYQMKSIYE
ncbi:glycoside hydrolase family 32 protein [Bacteroidota bacterium]